MVEGGVDVDGGRGDVVLQEVDDVLVHPLLGNVDGKSVHVVLDVAVGAVVEQGLGSLEKKGITKKSKYKKKLTITNITNISTDQVVIEFAVSQMRLQLTKSVIFAGVCCFVSQLSTFHSEHYLLFSCKEKVNIWGKRKIFP